MSRWLRFEPAPKPERKPSGPDSDAERGVLTSRAVRFPPPQALARVLAGVAPLLLAALALQQPGPLLLNLGAGDESFARGFRDRWERDGLTGAGETMFRWTLDGSRLEWPVTVTSGVVQARLRLARFLPTPVEVTVKTQGRVADTWTQNPRGWTIREVMLGSASGAMTLQFNSQSTDVDRAGLALDWVELSGAGRVWPTAAVAARVVLLLVGLPLLLGLFGTARDSLAASGVLAMVAPVAILLDRLGGLMALSGAAVPALLVTLGLVGARAVARGRGVSLPILLPALVSFIALIALSQPFYYYPDVDTHARFMGAGRRDPSLFFDPTPFQLQTGAWTREIAGRRVAFPYSPAFHIVAWPMAMVLGDIPAIKTLAVGAVAATLILVRALAAEAGLDPRAAALAPGLLATMPFVASRLTLALYPALLGQALELGLLLHLARRWSRVHRIGEGGPTLMFMLAALVAYTGSLINVSLVVATLAVLLLVAREPRSGARLVVLHAVALSLVVAVLYARFVPVLIADVLPYSSPEGSYALEGSAWQRLGLFYDGVYPALIAGLLVLRPGPARRAIGAALIAGLGLLVLRYAMPGVFRDAKDIELLAAPLAITAASAVAWLAQRGVPGRVVALVLTLLAVGWGLSRDVGLYADRFLAVGR